VTGTLTRLTVLTALAMALTAAVPAAGAFPYPYEVKQLDNHLKVILVPMKGSGLVAYYSVVRTGSRDEWEPGHTGFAHFFEHMMFRGTEKYPSAVYDRMITELGANSNAYTTDDYTCFHLVVASEDLPKVVELESDRFQNLSYPEQEFKTEAGAVYGEFLKSKASPFFQMEEKMMDTAFLVHTYKHTTMGFQKDIEAMPTMYDYSKQFFQRYYRPDNVVLLLVGDIDPEKALALIQKAYGQWRPGYVPPLVMPEPAQTAERRAEVTYTGRTLPTVSLGYKTPAFSAASKDWLSCQLFLDLAFGPTSDLYKELVLDTQKVQRLMPNMAMNRDPGLSGIVAMAKQDADLPAVEARIDETIRKFQSEPVTAEALQRQKSRYKYGFLMGLTSPEAVAGRLAPYIAMTGGIEAVDQLDAVLATLTPADIQAAARKYFVPEMRTVVTLKGEK
jgi:zinc protease